MGVYSYKIKAGLRYRYVFSHNGTPYQKKGFNTAKEAKAAEAIERNRVENFGTTNITFNNLVIEYIDDISNHIRGNTLETKIGVIKNHITGSIPDIKIKDIKPLHIRKWQSKMKSKKKPNGDPYAETFLKNAQNQLSAIFNFAVRFYDLPKNPVVVAGSLGKKNREEFNFWTIDEFIEILPRFENKLYYTVVHTLFFSGLRIGELIGLTWSDIDLEKGTLDVNKTRQLVKGKWVSQPPKTKKSKRVVTLNAAAIKVLKDWKSLQYKPTNTSLAFPTEKSAVGRAIAKAVNNTNIERITPHELRHSHASYLAMLDVNIKALSERLGHEKVQTTIDLYIHLYPSAQKNLVEKIEINLATILPQHKKETHNPL